MPILLFSIVPCPKSKGKAAAWGAHALTLLFTYNQKHKLGELMTKEAKVINIL